MDVRAAHLAETLDELQIAGADNLDTAGCDGGKCEGTNVGEQH